MESAVPQRQIEHGIRHLRELPPVRESQQHLLRIVNTDPDARDLARAIEKCPEVAARILGLARSAYFAQRIECRSIHDAIVRILGFRLVRSLVVGLILSGTFSPNRCPGFDTRRYWRDAVATAAIAHALARLVPVKYRPDSDNCYISGLLHNIGMLVLAHLWPKELSEVFTVAASIPERPLAEIESEILGTDHTVAGARLAYHWNLSPDVRIVIERHRVTTYRGPFWESAVLVGASAEVGKRILAGEQMHPESCLSLDVLDVPQEQFAVVVSQINEKLDGIADLTEVFA